MISVIIPLFNKESSIRQTLTSVLSQKFKDFEILIINDGSTDKSIHIIKENFIDDRIRIINKHNEGVSSARNLGVNCAKYDWLAFIDADDFWYKNHLKIISDVIKNKKNEGFISTGFYESSVSLSDKKNYSAKKEGLQNYFDVAIEKGFPVHSSAVCIKKNIFKNNLFNTNLTIGEDNDLFARIGKKYKVYFLKEASSLYFSDTENKATTRKHDSRKNFLYNINLSDKTISKNERIYYIIFIFYHLYKFLIRNKDFYEFYGLLKTYFLKFRLTDFYNILKFILKK